MLQLAKVAFIRQPLLWPVLAWSLFSLPVLRRAGAGDPDQGQKIRIYSQ